nr:uncharacterized protein LOC112023759 [Quercus suber]
MGKFMKLVESEEMLEKFVADYGIPRNVGLRQKGNKKHDKVHKDYKYKKYRRRSTKPNNFYDKKKNVYKKHDKQKSGKGNCFNCGKFGHFSKDCKQKLGKFKNKLNMLDINDNDKEDLFRILESRSSASSDSSEDDFLSLTDSSYHSNNETSDSLNIKIGCRDSCYNTINVLSKGRKTINVLTKGE